MAISDRTGTVVNKRARHGGLGVHIAVTASTLLILVVVVFAVVRTYQRNQTVYRRKALQVCEDGLVAALQTLSEKPSWRDGFSRTEDADGWYEVHIREVVGAQPPRLEVLARGTSGSVVRHQTSVLELSVMDGDSVWVQSSMREQ